MKNKQTFFDFAVGAGLTKHFGGHKATEELAGLCHIGNGIVPANLNEYFGYGIYMERKV